MEEEEGFTIHAKSPFDYQQKNDKQVEQKIPKASRMGLLLAIGQRTR